MSHSALTIAKYFLSIHDEDSGELISNLKLQKLLYYAQGYYVALNGSMCPLFVDKISAWKHGPVVSSVYHHYSKFGDGALPREKRPSAIDSETKSFVDEIYRVFGQYSAWMLRDMTHREMPWKKNFRPNEKNIEIPIPDLEEYFTPYVKKAKKGGK